MRREKVLIDGREGGSPQLDASVCACASVPLCLCACVCGCGARAVDKSDSHACLGHAARDVLFSGWADISRSRALETL